MSKQDAGAATILFMFVMGGAVALAVASDITEPLCRAAKIKEAAADKIVFGCLEFWINRYQGVISAFIAAAVAFIVVRPAFEQLREMKKQTATAGLAVVQNLVAQADDEIISLKVISDQCDAIKHVIARNEVTIGPLQDYLAAERDFMMVLMPISKAIDQLKLISARFNDSEIEQLRREEFFVIAQTQMQRFSEAQVLWKNPGSDVYGRKSPHPMSRDEQLAAQAKAIDANETLRAAAVALREEVLADRNRRIENGRRLREVAHAVS